jgi:hypothetical protein
MNQPAPLPSTYKRRLTRWSPDWIVYDHTLGQASIPPSQQTAEQKLLAKLVTDTIERNCL